MLTSLKIPLKTQLNWQETLDLLSLTLNIPSALIMRLHSHEIEVFTKSSNQQNVYKLGDTASLNTGLYCETVINTQQELLVPNALKDPVWEHNPDVDLGMVAYYGLPLTWPTGEPFGTICILDSKPNQFSAHARDLLERFQGNIQYYLANTYKTLQEKNVYINAQRENQELVAKYTSLVKSIPAVTYSAALDENSTSLFISKQIKTLIGCTQAEYENNSDIWFDHLHPADRDKVLERVNESHKSHLPFICEYRMLDCKGGIKWVRDEANIVKNEDGTPLCIQGLMYDITARKKIELREKSRSQVLELITRGELLSEVLKEIVLGVEGENPDMLCSILLLDDEGKHLLIGAGPSLPDFYNDAIHGMEIGLGAGSCGTSAFTGKRVIVDNTQTHPYWVAFKALALNAELMSCWSEPIFSSKGKILGTFAIYHHFPHQPTEVDMSLIEQSACLASIAIEKTQANIALKLSDEQMKRALAGADLGSWDWNIVTGKVEINERCAMMLGYTLEEVKHTRNQWRNLVHPEDRDKAQQSIDDVLENRLKNHDIEYRMLTKKDDYIWIHDQGSVMQRDSDGKALRMSGTHSDITSRKLADEKIKLASSVFTHARESIAITDTTGSIIDINNTFMMTTGYSREELIGQNPRILQSGRQLPEFYTGMWKALLEQGYWTGELWNRRKNGEVYAEIKTISAVQDEQGNTTHYVALGNDITSMKEHQDQLEHIAHYDVLTQLPNRSLLADRLSQAMLQCNRHEKSLAVAFLDLDGFKAVNDANGHDVGDELLIALSLRMQGALRENDSLSRIGGDEFVAVLTDLVTVEDCEPVLERLLLAASEPITIDGIILNVSASIGVTLYPQDNVDGDQLMRHADQAMYAAKGSGKNRYHLFDITQDDAIRTQRENLKAIRSALDNNQFMLHYQPKVNMRTGVVVGFEALIRWEHPERGLIMPLQFLPHVENNPMSIEVGEWVIDAVLTQISQWQSMNLNLPLSISVNICAMQLQRSDFTQRLTTLLAAHPDIEPSYLEIEVLETSALEDIKHVTTTMNDCKALGVSFALDDFGTGYSSLTYLRRLPASLIKIDQTFIRDMLIDDDDLAIVEGVIALAKSFKRDVIAEGVETVEHGTSLLQLGCDLAQGYGIARPMPANDIPVWVSNWKPDISWKS